MEEMRNPPQAYRPPIGIDVDDGEDDGLDPELAAIAASIAARSKPRPIAMAVDEKVIITLSMVSDPNPITPVLALDRRRFELPIVHELSSVRSVVLSIFSLRPHPKSLSLLPLLRLHG
jgi:hypothetical protein